MKTIKELQPLILKWANDRNLLHKENATKQRLKLIEEAGELAKGINENNIPLQKDSIGDMAIVLIILAEQINYKFHFEFDFESRFSILSDEILLIYIINESTLPSINIDNSFYWLNKLSVKLGHNLLECVNLSYNEIKDRKGETIDGVFIKN